MSIRDAPGTVFVVTRVKNPLGATDRHRLLARIILLTLQRKYMIGTPCDVKNLWAWLVVDL